MTDEITTRAIRPVDYTKETITQIIDMVMMGGEVPRNNLERGVPAAEMLFVTTTAENLVIGFGAIRFANTNYHKHLFKAAGVPQMYNPYSVESCWAYVKPEYRGRGVWQNNRAAKLKHLGNRPCHSIRRIGNKLPADNNEFSQAGKNFYSETSSDEIRLLVYNHDPVFDPEKGLIYGPKHPPTTSVQGSRK